jgi:hypothetical protein
MCVSYSTFLIKTKNKRHHLGVLIFFIEALGGSSFKGMRVQKGINIFVKYIIHPPFLYLIQTK